MITDLRELKVGECQEITLAIQKVEKAIARNGNPYQKLIVRDNNGNDTILFNFDEPVMATCPCVVNAIIETSENKTSPVSKLVFCKLLPDRNVDDFLPKGRINAKETIKALANKSKDLRIGLRKIVAEILNSHVKEFQMYPLRQSGSFSRMSGILEATLKLTNLAEHAAKDLGLDKDLMIAGAMLYYIGHTKTMDNTYSCTPDDILIGNGITSTIIVHDVAEKLKPEGVIVESDVKMLMHILASRFKGIPTAIPEACALRYLDAIVTETESMKEIQSQETTETVVAEKYGKVYCPGTTPNAN